MENLIEQHFKKFNKEPNIIGIFWYNIEKEYNNLQKAIETNTPYDEYELLTDEEKEAFDKGMLLF